MVGKTVGHYEILESLGVGGMGEVYRARDSKLGREVALKVLPADTASNRDRLERFRREAKAVAALTHPNIVTVYSVEDDPIHFLTMELVEGSALGERIPATGLPLETFFAIAVPLADAIAAAHEQGIVHRDLKPANIMITADDRVKVLDFGLAKLQPPPGARGATELPTEVAVTQEGVVVGTAPYMSPEQIEGRAIDHRTDVFSLGVVMYEMATGRLPFSGESSAGVMASILKDTPRAPTELREDLPPDLDSIVGRCLEKAVEDRFRTARELHAELRRLQRTIESGSADTAKAADARSRSTTLWVAVMPFANRSGDSDLESLAEGLSEGILTGLSRFSYLSVVSQKSSFAYKGRSLDPRSVGEELGARYVMEGSVRKAGSTLRVGVRLIDTATGAHPWAETYDRELAETSIFAVQDEITAQIVSTTADLHGVLPRSMSALVKAKPPETLTPYEAVLRKFDYWRLITAAEHLEVRACLERAVEEAPRYADAWAALSMMYAEEHKHSFNPRPDPLGRALTAARRAVDADSANHLAYHALAQAHFFRKEFGAFRVAAERAIALNPLDGVTVAFMGIMMAYAGDWEHGVAVAKGAAELNPTHPGWYRFAEVFNHYREGEYAEALTAAQKIAMPSYFYTHIALAATNARLGRAGAASNALRELLEQYPDFGDHAEKELSKWYPEDLVAAIIEGLRQAGLARASRE